MEKEAMSLYEGLRDTVEERCTIEGMKLPQLVPDNNAVENGFKVSRPLVNQVKVVIRVKGMWMLIDIKAIKEVIRSVMLVIKEWCTAEFGESELEEVPDFESEAFSFA